MGVDVNLVISSCLIFSDIFYVGESSRQTVLNDVLKDLDVFFFSLNDSFQVLIQQATVCRGGVISLNIRQLDTFISLRDRNGNQTSLSN